MEGTTAELEKKSNAVEIKGCGCRIRMRKKKINGEAHLIFSYQEHLCDDHKNQFILDLYNREHKILVEQDRQDSENLQE